MKVTSYIYNNLLPQTLVSRFLLIITIPTVVAQLVAIYVFYDRHWSNIINSTSRTVANEIKLITDIYEKYGLNIAQKEAGILDIKLKFQDLSTLSSNKKKLKYNESHDNLEILLSALNKTLKYQSNVRLINDESEIEISYDLPNGTLIFIRSVKPLIHPTTYIFVIWMMSLTLLLLTVSLIFSRNQIRSILELTRAADAFGHGGNTTLKYKPSGATEVRKAGVAFLKMKNRIEDYILKRTQTLAMISHDLKTPLTRIKLQLEMMKESDEVVEMKQDVISMQQMIASYLDFARGEGGEVFESVKILDWFKESLNINSYTNLKITYNANTNEYIEIKPYAFKRAIDNILSNANKYATTVLISFSTIDNKVILDIEDNGKGIGDEQKELAFKPFYRVDPARNIDASGNVGLGLSITREIITGHNGTVHLENGEILKGLKVRIILPKPISPHPPA
jgi:two-component system osmolarity sensor histidine kinase EnvZ